MSLHEDIAKAESELAANPSSKVFADLADSLRKLSRYDEAIKVARAGVLKHPNYFPGKLVLARSLFEFGELEESSEILKGLYRLASENVHILRILSQIHFVNGEYDKAEKLLKKLLELDPSDEVASEQLDKVSGQKADHTPSKSPSIAAPIAKIEVTEPNEPQSLATATLAKMYISQNLYQEARATLVELLSLNPENVEAKQLLVQLESMLQAKRAKPTISSGAVLASKQQKLETLLLRIAERRRAA